VETLQGMTLMLHKRELKSKGENCRERKASLLKVKRKARQSAFLFTT
jgi:hypothetical protein